MKRTISVLLLVAVLIILTSCSRNLTNKEKIVNFFQKNEDLFLQAADSKDYNKIEQLDGVQKLYLSEEYIDIQCGGSGFGSGTHYYGIFYSEDDNLCAIDVAGPIDELIENGDGYLYQQENGDNRYYVEPLGNHFYYYEAHF